MQKKERCDIIIEAAVKVMNDKGLIHLSHQNVADACRVETSHHTVRTYYSNRAELLTAIKGDPRLTEASNMEIERSGM